MILSEAPCFLRLLPWQWIQHRPPPARQVCKVWGVGFRIWGEGETEMGEKREREVEVEITGDADREREKEREREREIERYMYIYTYIDKEIDG
jgi:hypothetical protein